MITLHDLYTRDPAKLRDPSYTLALEDTLKGLYRELDLLRDRIMGMTGKEV